MSSKSSRGNKGDDKKDGNKKRKPAAAEQRDKKKMASTKKTKKPMEDNSSSSEDDFIPPPPNRRIFSLHEPPNPTRHGAAASSSLSTPSISGQRGTLNHIPDSIDELFGPGAERDRWRETHQSYVAPPIGVEQRRIFNLAGMPPGNARSETTTTGPGRLASAPTGRMARDMRIPIGSSPAPSPVAESRPSRHDVGIEPVIPHLRGGVWNQESVSDCRRFYMPEPVKFAEPVAEGVVVYHNTEQIYNPNTLIIEGILDAQLDQHDGAAPERMLQLRVTLGQALMNNDPLYGTDSFQKKKVYVTWLRAEPHFRTISCQHKYQPYVHCQQCALPERLGDSSTSPQLPDFFKKYRLQQVDAKEYRVLHISTKPPLVCDTDSANTEALFNRSALLMDLGEVLVIPLQGQIRFIDVVDRCKLSMTNEHVVDLLVGPRERTVIMTARLGSEIQFAGLFQELMILATHRSTVKGVSATCQSLLAVANSGCRVEGCVATELMEVYLDGDGQVAQPIVQPTRFILNNYSQERRSWVELNPRMGASGRATFQAFHPAHIPMGVLAAALLGGDDNEDDEAFSDMPVLEDSRAPHRFQPMDAMRMGGMVFGARPDVLREVLARSMNEHPRPQNPIDPNTFRCAPRPKKPEDQPLPREKESACSICLTYRPNHLVIPCGHKCICSWCANEMKDKASEIERKCPICMQPMSNVQIVYDT